MCATLSQMYSVLAWSGKDVANSPHVHRKTDSSLKTVAALANPPQDKHMALTEKSLS